MIAVILRILNDSFPAGNYLIDDMNPYNSYNICIKCYQNNDCNTTIQGLSGQMTCQITYVTDAAILGQTLVHRKTMKRNEENHGESSS